MRRFMGSKIQYCHFENFGILPTFDFYNLSSINLIIGENGTGKTAFLKALYAAARAMEEYKRGDDIRSMADILSENAGVPEKLLKYDLSEKEIKLVLVVKNAEKEWLMPLQEKLRSELRVFCALWKINGLFVINERTARQKCNFEVVC